jgi:hypothetical protein
VIAAMVEGASLLRSVLASGVVAALVAAVVSLVALATSGRRARQDRQRQLFADAFEACIEYREFAYIVRRRRDESADEVARITGAMSDVQTRLRSVEARLRVESPRVGAAYSKLVVDTKDVAGPQVRSGWEAEPVPPDRTGRIEDVDFAPLAAADAEFLDAARDHLAILPWWIRSPARRGWRRLRGQT